MDDKSSVSKHVRLPDGSEFEVQSGNQYAVVRLADAINNIPAQKVPGYVHDRVQQGLDWLSASGHEQLLIQGKDRHKITWYKDNILNINFYSIIRFPVKTGKAEISVEGEKGKEEGPIEITRVPKSFRYYRISKTTEDLYDAFRNMYLSFECTLSEQHPKPKSKNTKDWIIESLKEDSKIDLCDELDMEWGKVEDILKNVIYEGARNNIFHAKYRRVEVIPGINPENREDIELALGYLKDVVCHLFEKYYSVRPSTGWMNPVVFYNSIKEWWDDSRVDVRGSLSGDRNLNDDCVRQSLKTYSNGDIPYIESIYEVEDKGENRSMENIRVIKSDGSIMLGYDMENELSINCPINMRVKFDFDVVNLGRGEWMFSR